MTHCLFIKVAQGNNLLAADPNGFSDPFAIVSVDKQSHKTKKIKKTLNPKWNETFSIHRIPVKSTLNVRLMDWDRFGSNDFLGSVDIDLQPYWHGKPKAKWFPLQYFDKHKGHISAGEILLVLHLTEEGGKSLLEAIPTSPTERRIAFTKEGVGQLAIEIVAGKGLAVKDVGGTSDPYCKVKVGGLESKTNIIEKTLDPIWNEEFFFKVDPDVANISIKLFDWDLVGRDDPMGVVKISLKDIGDEKMHDKWWEIKPQKNEKVSGLLHARIQYTSPQNSQQSSIIAKENYLSLSMLLTRNVPMMLNILRIYESQEMVRSIVHLFNSEKKVIPLLTEAIHSEVVSAQDESALFCGDTTATKMIVEYFKWLDKQCTYLKSSVYPIVNYVLEHSSQFEVDPQRTHSPNPKFLQDTAQRLLNLIFSTKIPGPIKEILSIVKKYIVETFPSAEKKILVDVFFLRFICAAIFTPEFFGLLQEPPTQQGRRALTLLAKIMHNIAHGELFEQLIDKESYMVPFNPIIVTNRKRFDDLIDSIAIYAPESELASSVFNSYCYSDEDKQQNMALIVKHLHSNFVKLTASIISRKDDADPIKTAEAKLYFDEMAIIFGKYNT